MRIPRKARRGGDLQPKWPDRTADFVRGLGPAGRRVRVIRRLTALALLLLAGVLALAQQRAPQPGRPVVALTRDLPVGSHLQDSDLTVLHLPTVPDGAVSAVDQAAGRVLAGPARRGEIITDLRLVTNSGPDPGPGRVAVPIRPADPATLALLAPGMHVAVIEIGEKGAATTITTEAVVLALPPPVEAKTPALAVLAVPTKTADRVAGASAAGLLTLRFS